MKTPPTWRDLGRRARRLGVTLNHGDHTASLFRHDSRVFYLESWGYRREDAIILRTAVAAALEQLEARR